MLELRAGEYYNSPVIDVNTSNDLQNSPIIMYQNALGIITLSGSSKITIWAMQKSGTVLSVDGTSVLTAIRIK